MGLANPGNDRLARQVNALEKLLTGVSALVGLLGHQPPTLFRKAHAVIAFKLDPALVDSIEDRASRSAVDTRQHPPSPRLPIGCGIDHPHNMLG
jgi:hypothetical protein